MNKIPIACQLYSMHDEWSVHPLETLRFLKETGYTGVELFGNYFSPEFTAAVLREAGLVCVGWHVAIEDFSDENFDATVKKALTVGARSLIIAWYGADSEEQWKEYALRLNEISAKLAAYGIRFGFHSHAGEFKPLANGLTPWEIIGENTDSSVVMQIDMGNTLSGGADAYQWLTKYAGRTQLIHCKPWSKEGGFDLTKGDDVPWKETLEWCRNEGKTEWLIVEYEAGTAEGTKAALKQLYDTLAAVR